MSYPGRGQRICGVRVEGGRGMMDPRKELVKVKGEGRGAFS